MKHPKLSGFKAKQTRAASARWNGNSYEDCRLWKEEQLYIVSGMKSVKEEYPLGSALTTGGLAILPVIDHVEDYEPVHFFDLFSDLPGASKSWSYNTLKVRAVLNFKGIPYTQSWISYPDIKPLITGLGLPPNEQGRPYTLPAIIHKSSVTSNPNGAMMGSFPIVMHLDKVFPSPPLFPSGDASYALLVAIDKIMSLLEPAYRPLIIPHVADHLDPRGQKYFHVTRAAFWGKPLREVLPTDKESLNKLWTLAETESTTLIKMLRGREAKKGPFFEGEKPGFADLLFGCHLTFIERFDKELFQRFLDLGTGEIKSLYKACLPWLEGQGKDKEWPVSPPI